MSPSLPTDDYEKQCDRLAVGHLDFGNGFHIAWDLTSILEERRKRERLAERHEHFISNGRTLMPSLGIY